MKKFLNTAKSILNTAFRSVLLSNWSIMDVRIFLYIGKPQFWVVLGFGIIFTGVQNIINEIKLKRN